MTTAINTAAFLVFLFATAVATFGAAQLTNNHAEGLVFIVPASLTAIVFPLLLILTPRK